MANKGVSSPGGGRGVSEIFNPNDQPSPARKVRETQKSSIVNTGVGIDTNGNMKRATLSPRHQDNTKQRLFGAEDGGDGESPRRNSDTWRSNIIFSDNGQNNGSTPEAMKRTPKKRFPSGGMNPITGSPLRQQLNCCSPSRTNGLSNGGGSGTNGFDHHEDVLTVVLGAEKTAPVAMLNGHGMNGH